MIATINPAPGQRVQVSADEALVGDTLGQPQTFLQSAEGPLVVAHAGARQAFTPETSYEWHEESMLPADLDTLACDRQRLVKTAAPDGNAGEEVRDVTLQGEVTHRAAY
jgi:hypothetical protein